MFSHDLTAVVSVVRIRTKPCKGNESGVVAINASDYDATKHQLVDDGEQPSLPLEGEAKKAESVAENKASNDGAAAPGPFSQK